MTGGNASIKDDEDGGADAVFVGGLSSEADDMIVDIALTREYEDIRYVQSAKCLWCCIRRNIYTCVYSVISVWNRSYDYNICYESHMHGSTVRSA